MGLFSRGKSDQEVWEEVATAVGGKIIGERSVWQDTRRIEAHAADGPWIVSLNIYVVTVMVGNVPVPMTFARAVAPFPVRGVGLKLSVGRANPFTSVAKLFGMQDIEVGDEAFDRAFVLKGSEAEQVLRLLSSEPGTSLREKLTGFSTIQFGISDDGREARMGKSPGENAATAEEDVVYAVASATGPEVLVALHALISDTLRGLKRIGIASAPQADR